MTKTSLASLLLRGALLFVVCATPVATIAQTISVPASANQLIFTNSAAGQSFTATVTGIVSAIQVQPFQTTTPTLLIYNGANGSGVADAKGNPVYTQPGVTFVAGKASGIWQTVTLTTPFPVVAGSSYTFIFDGATQFRVAAAAYAGGSIVSRFGVLGGEDIAFQIFETALAPVPTMSEWALVVLAGGLGLAGWAAVRRRSRA